MQPEPSQLNIDPVTFRQETDASTTSVESSSESKEENHPLGVEPAKSIREQIKWAAEEANILLEYTVHKGIEIDDDTFNTIIEAKYIKTWDAEKEINFWKAYRNISIAIRPATVQSIKAGKGFYGRKVSWVLKLLTGRWSQATVAQSRIAVLRYRAVAIVVLLIIIIAQIYSFTGSELTKENKELRRAFDSLLVKSWLVHQKLVQANTNPSATADSTEYWQLYYELGKVETMLEANFNYMIGWHKWWTRAATIGLYTPNIQKDTAAVINMAGLPLMKIFSAIVLWREWLIQWIFRYRW